jgi:hypothetical protein
MGEGVVRSVLISAWFGALYRIFLDNYLLAVLSDQSV